jgi:RHS repeat-associated protein
MTDCIPGQNDFRIGGRQAGGRDFSGSIDEVRVYNRALSGDEVRGLAGDSVQYVYGLDLISQKRNGTTRYYGYDGLGSVRYVADDDGDVVDTYTYDAFGILTERKARTSGGTWALFDLTQPETPPAGTTPTVNNYRYTGEQWDPDLGMYYLRARYYKPDIGRFWTMDSYEGSSQDPLSLHKYLYCQGNSVNGVDPSGYDYNAASLITAGIQIARLGGQVGIHAYAAYDRAQWVRDGLIILGKLAASGAVDPVALSMWASDLLPGKKIWNKLKVVGNRVLGMSDSLTRVYKAAINGSKRAAEQIGEIGAAAVARKLGMRPTTFEPGYHGIDDIYEQNGKLIIVEAKGGTSTLAEGQMSRKWINHKIEALKRKGDPWGSKLEQARDSGQLQGMVVTTKVDAGDVVQDPVFNLKDFQNIGGSSF